MQAKHFSDTDTLLVQFSRHDIAETYALNEDVLVEVDKDGILIEFSRRWSRGEQDNRTVDSRANAAALVWSF
jgi:uncharacterized protein YuzE